MHPPTPTGGAYILHKKYGDELKYAWTSPEDKFLRDLKPVAEALAHQVQQWRNGDMSWRVEKDGYLLYFKAYVKRHDAQPTQGV